MGDPPVATTARTDSGADIELVRSSFEALNRADVDAVLAHYHTDCVFDATRLIEGTYRSRAEFRRFLEAVFQATDLHWDEISFIAAGDHLVVIASVHGTGAISDAPMERRFAFRYWVEGGLIRRQEVHPDVDAVLSEVAESG